MLDYISNSDDGHDRVRISNLKRIDDQGGHRARPSQLMSIENCMAGAECVRHPNDTMSALPM